MTQTEKAGGNGNLQANVDRDIFDLVKQDLSTQLLILLGGDLDARNRLGWNHHSKMMQAFDGCDALGDAYEEALDELPYLRKDMVEHPERAARVAVLYARAVQHAAQLKALLLEAA